MYIVKYSHSPVYTLSLLCMTMLPLHGWNPHAPHPSGGCIATTHNNITLLPVPVCTLCEFFNMYINFREAPNGTGLSYRKIDRSFGTGILSRLIQKTQTAHLSTLQRLKSGMSEFRGFFYANVNISRAKSQIYQR